MTGPPPPTPRRGRRPAGEDTRGLIEEAARAEFAEKGYDGTTLRAVARRAGVDAALVHHYFEGKADLFAQAVVLTRVNPGHVVARLLEGPTRPSATASSAPSSPSGTTPSTANGWSPCCGPRRPTTTSRP